VPLQWLDFITVCVIYRHETASLVCHESFGVVRPGWRVSVYHCEAAAAARRSSGLRLGEGRTDGRTDGKTEDENEEGAEECRRLQRPSDDGAWE
jgi:hypothetical protein